MMLHEILYAMVGKLGTIIIDIDGVYRVNPSLDFIQSSEREMLEKIVMLGSFYKRISMYVEEDDKMFHNRILYHHESPSEAAEEEKKIGGIGNSVYIRSICFSTRLLLSEYEKEVLAVEQAYLTSKVYTFSNLTVKFSKFYYLFPEVILMFEHLEETGLAGGQLIDYVYSNSINGNEVIRGFYSLLLDKLYSVFYTMMVNWLLHGRLHDPYNEFFIQRLVPEHSQPEENGEKSSNRLEEWNRTFSIRPSMVPRKILPLATAEKIMFIGKYVRVVSRARDTIEIRHFSKETLENIKSLSRFEYSKFQDGIEAVRAEVGKEFLKIFLTQENIEEHLKYLKDYYLMGKGDFFQIFIEECTSIFKLPPNKYSENDLNNMILPAVLMRLNMNEGKVGRLIYFTLSNVGFEYRDFTQLNGLHIHGDITQPGNMLRFASVKKGKTPACVYHTTSQSIANGFDLKVAFKFKRETSDIETREAIPRDVKVQERCSEDTIGINSLAVAIHNHFNHDSKVL